MQATKNAPPAHHTTRQNAAAAVTEAVENANYWRRQSLLRIQPAAIAEAKGLASAWETTRKARQARLDALNALQPQA